jgi:hypothetical protein
MSKRHINLGITTNGAEEHFRLHQDLSELARQPRAESHEYVTVSTIEITESDEEIKGDPEGLYYDEYTILKVRQAIMNSVAKNLPGVVSSYEELDSVAMEAINELQNEGLLFRERPKQ